MLNLISGLLGGKNGALKQVASVIDELHTSEEEKLDKKILRRQTGHAANLVIDQFVDRGTITKTEAKNIKKATHSAKVG